MQTRAALAWGKVTTDITLINENSPGIKSALRIVSSRLGYPTRGLDAYVPTQESGKITSARQLLQEHFPTRATSARSESISVWCLPNQRGQYGSFFIE